LTAEFMDMGTSKSFLSSTFPLTVMIHPVIVLVPALFVCSIDTHLCGAAPNEGAYKIIKSLEGLGATPCALIEGKDGRLYGALETGGSKGEGGVFALGKDGTGYSVLHGFTGASVARDGSDPQGLIEGSDGVLYGTTKAGGTPGGVLEALGVGELGNGTVFKVKNDGTEYAVLHRFTGKDGDGSQPWAGVVEGPEGALYGTTLEDGREHQGVFGAGHGTVFRLNKNGSGYQVVHTFGLNPADGDRPFATLLVGLDALLYGTTDGGGSGTGRNGVVFKMKPDGSDYAVLHSFPTVPSDGRMPRSALVEGPDGLLYGTTQNGGSGDYGTVFRLNKDGSGYRVLHSFTGGSGEKLDPQGPIRGVLNGIPDRWFYEGGNGATPQQLVRGRDGKLYGTAHDRGKNGSGTLFEIGPDGNGFIILHNFPDFDQDGRHPSKAITRSSDGALYGVTSEAGDSNASAVFRFATTIAPQGR
jgi:uncharacterized repeat protein (TIGR03803 family)